MGVVNVTPDSFSDGGRWVDPDAALAHARRLVADGADIIDVGGESTRPGATRPSVQEEIDRVLPLVSRLAADGTRVSVDTMRAEVAEAALREGAALINDVSGGRADDAMFGVVAAAGAPYVLMHWRAHSVTMQQRTEYVDVVDDVMRELVEQRDAGRRGRHRAGADRAGPGHRVLQDRRAELGRARPRPSGSTAWGTRCSSPRAASASSVPCSPPTTARCARPSSGTTAPPRPRRWPPQPERGASGCTRCGRPRTPSGWRSGGPRAGRRDEQPGGQGRGRRGQRGVLPRLRGRRPRRDAGPVARRRRDAVRAPGGAAGAGHRPRSTARGR